MGMFFLFNFILAEHEFYISNIKQPKYVEEQILEDDLRLEFNLGIVSKGTVQYRFVSTIDGRREEDNFKTLAEGDIVKKTYTKKGVYRLEIHNTNDTPQLIYINSEADEAFEPDVANKQLNELISSIEKALKMDYHNSFVTSNTKKKAIKLAMRWKRWLLALLLFSFLYGATGLLKERILKSYFLPKQRI